MKQEIFQIEPTERQKSLPNTERMSLFLAEVREIFDPTLLDIERRTKNLTVARSIWNEMTEDEKERSLVYFQPPEGFIKWLETSAQ